MCHKAFRGLCSTALQLSGFPRNPCRTMLFACQAISTAFSRFICVTLGVTSKGKNQRTLLCNALRSLFQSLPGTRSFSRAIPCRRANPPEYGWTGRQSGAVGSAGNGARRGLMHRLENPLAASNCAQSLAETLLARRYRCRKQAGGCSVITTPGAPTRRENTRKLVNFLYDGFACAAETWTQTCSTTTEGDYDQDRRTGASQGCAA